MKKLLRRLAMEEDGVGTVEIYSGNSSTEVISRKKG